MMDFDAPEQLPSEPHKLLSHFFIDGAGGNERQIQKARLALYGSHTLAAWGQRSWEFAVGLIMLEVWPHSLALVSAYGLADQASQVLAGTAIGAHITRQGRLRGAMQMYLLQNVAVFLSAAAVLPLLSVAGKGASHDWLYWLLITCTIAFGSASTVGSMGSTLAVERQWTKALCLGDSAALSALNSGMRRIDLTCLIISPIAVGCLITYCGTVVAVIAICCWNLVAWLPECLLLTYSIRQAPWLQETGPSAADSVMPPDSGALKESNSSIGFVAATKQALLGTLGGWRMYWTQAVLPAAFALALLYLTVLSFGLQMTAFLKSEGMTEVVLSVFRGIGAAAGVAATFTFPFMASNLGLVGTAVVGIWIQVATLWAGVTPSLLPLDIFQRATGSHVNVPAAVATHALVSGVAASRWGLWTFDLAVSQMLQERIDDRQLSMVAGVQGSLQSLLGLASYVATLVAPSMTAFPWLMAASCVVVTAAAMLVTSTQRQLQHNASVLPT